MFSRMIHKALWLYKMESANSMAKCGACHAKRVMVSLTKSRKLVQTLWELQKTSLILDYVNITVRNVTWQKSILIRDDYQAYSAVFFVPFCNFTATKPGMSQHVSLNLWNIGFIMRIFFLNFRWSSVECLISIFAICWWKGLGWS